MSKNFYIYWAFVLPVTIASVLLCQWTSKEDSTDVEK
jgi:hypothetical protein